MNVVSAVANLSKERDFYKEQYEQCKGIIKQLTEGPGEFEYIHPYDVAEMINNPNSDDVLNIYKQDVEGSRVFIFKSTGKKYIQSANIPAKTERVK